MVRASVLLTAAEIDRGEWPTGQGGSHGEVGRAGRQYLRAKMIPCSSSTSHNTFSVTRQFSNKELSIGSICSCRSGDCTHSRRVLNWQPRAGRRHLHMCSSVALPVSHWLNLPFRAQR